MIMSGPAGSGRSTAIGALEDLGFEAIDNLPISFLPRLFAGGAGRTAGGDRHRPAQSRLLRRRAARARSTRSRPTAGARAGARLSRLRRRHAAAALRRDPAPPSAQPAASSPLVGIEREVALLAPLRARADVLIDTRAMTPHELRAEMAPPVRRAKRPRGGLAMTLQSFSYKRGVPPRHRHGDRRAVPAEPALGYRACDRATAATPRCAAFVEADPAYAPFYERLVDLVRFLLPRLPGGGKELLRSRPGLHRRQAPLGRRWSRRWRNRLRQTGGRCLFGIATWSRRLATWLRVWEWVSRDRNRYRRAWRPGPRIPGCDGACGRQASRHRRRRDRRRRQLPLETGRGRRRGGRRSTRARAWWW